MHLKRQKISKNWPLPRKGSVYVVRPKSNLDRTIPILLILRDILNLAKTKKEAKRIIHGKNVVLNGKIVYDEKNPMGLFDVLSLPLVKKNYKLDLTENGKFKLEDIKESESGTKIAKITNKTLIKGKKIQLNFSDGRNILSQEKCKTNDSAVINFKSKKIEKIIPLKENSKVIIFSGKHIGGTGKIEKLNEQDKTATIKVGDKMENVLIKQVMVIEN